MSVTTKKFWVEANERAIKSAAQVAIAAIGASATNILDFTILTAAGAGIVTGYVLSILTSIATSGVGPDETPSVV